MTRHERNFRPTEAVKYRITCLSATLFPHYPSYNTHSIADQTFSMHTKPRVQQYKISQLMAKIPVNNVYKICLSD